MLNAKTRTIGVDVATLDAQVAAKAAADAAAVEVTRKEDEALLAVDTHLKLVELDRQRIHKEASAGVSCCLIDVIKIIVIVVFSYTAT